MAKLKTKRGKHPSTSRGARQIRKIDIIAISISWFFLLILWTGCLINVIKGNFIGYRNYYGQNVGIVLLLIFLVVATYVCLVMTIRTIKKRKVDLYSTPKWMDTPPWKWPWN
jgi:hypothetical protein